MPVKLSSLAVTPNNDGDWEDSVLIPGAKFLVRQITYPPFAIGRDQMMARLRRQHRDSIPPHVQSQETGRIVAKHLLLGWQGFDAEYSPEVAADLLSNPEYHELVAAVVAAAIAASSAKVEYVDGTAKN